MLDSLAMIAAFTTVASVVWRFARQRGRRQVTWAERRAVLIIAAGVGAGFWVVIALGFRLHDQPAPGGLDAGLLPAAIVLIVAVAMGVRRIWRNRVTGLPSISIGRIVRTSREQSRAMTERKAWLAAVAADPQRRRYAALIEAGDVFWSPDRVEYDLDPTATTCCEHLAPLESAMRRAGLQVRLDAAGSARAECRIDVPALAEHFILPKSVKYEEVAAYDRSLEDPPQARLFCSACQSRIWVVHPRVAATTTQSFPPASG